MFFETKHDWYSMTQDNADPEAGYLRLDSFFKSVATLMSNQLWSIARTSIKSFEGFFRQFSNADSAKTVFNIHLVVQNGHIRFSPSLQDIEKVMVDIYEMIVSALREVPKVETKLFSSLSSKKLFISSMSIEDAGAQDGNVVRSILTKNMHALQKHVLSYEKYKPLLNHKAEKRIEEFLHEKHDLDDFEGVWCCLACKSLVQVLIHNCRR
jgi:dynein heavy chain